MMSSITDYNIEKVYKFYFEYHYNYLEISKILNIKLDEITELLESIKPNLI